MNGHHGGKMTRNDPRLAAMALDPHGVRLPEIPGIIDGRMAVYPGTGSSVSFRVIVGVSDGRTVKRDLIELIIGAEPRKGLTCALTQHRAGITSDADSMPSSPCHIGFCLVIRHPVGGGAKTVFGNGAATHGGACTAVGLCGHQRRAPGRSDDSCH